MVTCEAVCVPHQGQSDIAVQLQVSRSRDRLLTEDDAVRY